MARGMAVGVGGGTITQRRQLFQIFPFKGGDYLRAEWLLFDEIQ